MDRTVLVSSRELAYLPTNRSEREHICSLGGLVFNRMFREGALGRLHSCIHGNSALGCRVCEVCQSKIANFDLVAVNQDICLDNHELSVV